MRLSIIIAVATVILILAMLTWRSLLAAPLTSGLGSGTWEVVSERFDSRVKRAFPIGSSEDQMIQELRRQGFSLTDEGEASGQENEAVRREDNWVCNIGARVYWRADAGGELIAIRGAYREEGCL